MIWFHDFEKWFKDEGYSLNLYAPLLKAFKAGLKQQRENDELLCGIRARNAGKFDYRTACMDCEADIHATSAAS